MMGGGGSSLWMQDFLCLAVSLSMQFHWAPDYAVKSRACFLARLQSTLSTLALDPFDDFITLRNAGLLGWFFCPKNRARKIPKESGKFRNISHCKIRLTKQKTMKTAAHFRSAPSLTSEVGSCRHSDHQGLPCWEGAFQGLAR